MKKINQIGIALLISAIIGCGVVKGQESGESFTGINFSSFSDNGVLALSGTNMISVKSWSDDQLTILVGALGEVSTIPITSLPTNRWGGPIGGTYWSLQNPGMPPLPSDTLGVDVWPMADGSFLLDDLDLDYSGGSGSPMGMRAMDSPAGPGFGDGGGGTNYYATTNSYVQPNYGTNLWIAQTAVASGYLTGVGSNTLAAC